VSSTRLVALTLAGTGVLASACGAPPLPEVSFYSAGTTVTSGPAQYCTSDMSKCPVYSETGAKLKVPPNKPVQISVPAEVAGAVWYVGFSYRKPNGQVTDVRTDFFPAGRQWAYTLLPPDPGDRLISASVQKFGTVLTLDNDGQIGFHVSGVWLLDVA
jgi:Protein of unknown function (DUF2771)